jgi:hypothetical protein
MRDSASCKACPAGPIQLKASAKQVTENDGRFLSLQSPAGASFQTPNNRLAAQTCLFCSARSGWQDCRGLSFRMPMTAQSSDKARHQSLRLERAVWRQARIRRLA